MTPMNPNMIYDEHVHNNVKELFGNLLATVC